MTQPMIVLNPAKWFLNLKNLELNESHLFLSLAALGRCPTFTARTSAIASAAGVSEHTVRKALKGLAAKGLLAFEWNAGPAKQVEVTLSWRWVRFTEVA